MDENIAEFYYDRLKESTNPIGVLVNFYVSLFNLEKAENDMYRIFARMYKIYGRDTVFFSLLDCSEIEVVGDISRLIAYFAKKRLEAKYNYSVPMDLSKLSLELEKSENKKRKIKVKIDPFEEETNEWLF